MFDFMFNDDWHYFDENERKYKLTDKAKYCYKNF